MEVDIVAQGSAPVTCLPDVPVEKLSVKALTLLSLKRTFELFNGNHGESLPVDEDSMRMKLAIKHRDEYEAVSHLTAPAAQAGPAAQPAAGSSGRQQAAAARPESKSQVAKLIDSVSTSEPANASTSKALAVYKPEAQSQQKAIMSVIKDTGNSSAAISRRLASKWPKPEWHAPWKMYRVIAGHLGWVRCVAVDPGNEWFATGSADRTIKIWDLASGQLKLTLTGHIEQVMGIAISNRHPYMFSCGLDKQVKNWDLEQNKVIRDYHGHLSGVYSIALHPELDLLMTGGRDSVVRVWDMRSKVQAMVLSGHEQTVCSLLTDAADPQVISGSHDNTIRLWDLRNHRSNVVLTHHKKSIRAMAKHPTEWSFCSASAENIKKFALPNGDFLHNLLVNQRAIVNAMSVNQDGVMATGGDNGSLWFWDWKSGHCFQQDATQVQPGSMESEGAIYATAYDMSGSRLITCEGDKTIKLWKEVEHATPSSHPGLPFKPPKDIQRF